MKMFVWLALHEAVMTNATWVSRVLPLVHSVRFSRKR